MDMEVEVAVHAMLEAARTRPVGRNDFARERRRLGLHPHEAVASLAPALVDPAPAVRRFAAQLLRELDHEEARSALRPALADLDEDVRLEVAGALLREPLPPPGWDAPSATVEAALRAELVSALMPLVGAPRFYVFEDAVRKLVRLAAPDLATALRPRLPEPDWNVRSRIFLGLERALGGASALRALVDHSDAETRASALRSFAASRSSDAREAHQPAELGAMVLARLADPAPAVRAVAAQLAGKHAVAEAEPMLLALLGGANDMEAVDALGALSSERALPALLERAHIPGASQHSAIDAIARFEPRLSIEDALLAVLASEADPYAKLAAASALAEHGTTRAVPALEHFRRAARGLAKRSRKPALRALPAWIEQARSRPPWQR